MIPTAVVVPAFQSERTIGDLVRSLSALWAADGRAGAIIVVDDGSTDATGSIAKSAGAMVLCHNRNRGKGAALRTGLEAALHFGFVTAVSVDADGQHPPSEARRLAELPCPPEALVLGVRDLLLSDAPTANRFSNAISNYFLSLFSRHALADTQCGLRRYPIRRCLALQARDDGFAFEAEILLLAIHAGIPIVEVPIDVIYGSSRTTHFRTARDPLRIITRVVRTLLRTRVGTNHSPAAGKTQAFHQKT